MIYGIVFATFLAAAFSKPVDDQFVHVHQDTVGNYKATYNTGDIFRTEEGTHDGQILGHYTYVDGDGNVQKIEYNAGTQGFVATGTNLPVAPVAEPENPDVVKAREEHLAAYNEVLKYLPITDEFYQNEKVADSPVETLKVVQTSHHHGLVPVVRYVPYEIEI